MKHPKKLKRITSATIRAAWKKKARALTQPQRQQALDMIRDGKRLGDVMQALSVDHDTVLGIVELCTVKHTYTTLAEVAP